MFYHAELKAFHSIKNDLLEIFSDYDFAMDSLLNDLYILEDYKFPKIEDIVECSLETIKKTMLRLENIFVSENTKLRSSCYHIIASSVRLVDDAFADSILALIYQIDII
jgi:hypothetical protein